MKPGEQRRRAQLQRTPKGGGVKGTWALEHIDGIIKGASPTSTSEAPGAVSPPRIATHGRAVVRIDPRANPFTSARLHKTFQNYYGLT